MGYLVVWHSDWDNVACEHSNVIETGNTTDIKLPATVLVKLWSQFTAFKLSFSYLSKTYDDAVELQQLFVSQRDKLCKDGERFVSPALVIIKRHLLQELDEERKTKAEAEAKEDSMHGSQTPQVSV